MSTTELASRKLGQNASDRLRTSDKKDTFKKQEKNKVKQPEAGGRLLNLQSSLGNQAVLGMLDKNGKLEEGSGSLIPESIKGKMEASFGTDFSDVRIHESPNAQAMGARAMTRGSEIFFAPGQFTAATQEGQSLLGHELSHVVQQREGRVEAPQTGAFPLVDNSGLESEADREGEMASRGISARNTGSETGHVSAATVQAGAQTSVDNAPVQASFFSSIASGAKKAFGAVKKFATSKEGRAMIGGALTAGGQAYGAGGANPLLAAGMGAAGGMISGGGEAAGEDKAEEEKALEEEKETA